MKAIMISDKPKWCALMMNGDKNIEVRKNKALASAIKKLIDEYGYADIYVYCSKDSKNGLYFVKEYVCVNQKGCIPSDKNGKVLFKFRCYRVDRIWKTTTGIWTYGDEIMPHFFEDTCLTDSELNQYFKPKREGFKYSYGYAIHISDLEIFDKPRELNEFMTLQEYEKYQKALEQAWKDDGEISTRIYEGIANEWECANAVELTEMTKWCYGLTKAPQNFCYVEVE